MPPVVAFVVAVGTAAAAAVGVALVGGAAFAVGAAIIVGGTMLVTKLATPDINQGVQDNDRSRQVTARGTIESQKIIYGEALVSGPLAFVGVSGTGNKNLHHVVSLAGHQIEAITEIWLDDQVISSANISGNGGVQSGTFAPLGGENIVKIVRNLGTSTQVADTDLVLAFSGYTAAHRGRGIANIATTFVLNDASQELWDKYAPNNIKALVQGRNQVYDPRLDSTAGASPANSTYQSYTDNPALCVVDYLINTTFGMSIAAGKIDWAAVVTAADACDQLVSIPTGATQKRFTANGVLFATDKHQISINKLLSSMNGTLIYTSGTYVVRAGIYEDPTESLDENDLIGPITVKTSVERSDRFNTCGGVFIDPAQQHKSMEFPKVQLTAALNRDNGEVLEREIDLSFTNSSFMAQRIANKLIQLSDQQKLVSFPCNLSGLRVAVGDRVNVTIEDFGWTNKVFRCMAWAFSDNGGVDLTLAEDDSGSYADPAEGEYSTITATGAIVDGFPGVPDPQNLAAAAGIKSIDLNWTNPENVSKFAGVILYASGTSAWGAAVEIGRGMLTSFKHDASTTADPITNGDERWYWVRAIGTGSSGQVLSDRNPDNDTSTINATAALNQAQLIEWTDVADTSGLRPVNNATVGAQASVDLKNAAGVVLGDTDVLNELLRIDILTVELEDGQILDFETGVEVSIQNLGDVAVWANDSNRILQSANANITDLIVDITAGVGDVYVQASAPVAGVDGVPNPIVTSSRWYDSDDSNAPYYWDGSTWVSLLDPRIASNQNSIVSLEATVNNATTGVAATSTALGILDATVVTLKDDTVVAIASDVTDLESTVDDATTGVAATSTALGLLETRVFNTEGSISTNSTDITNITSEVVFYNKIEDEDAADGTIDFEDGTPVDIQTTDTVGLALSTASSILDTRVLATENTILTQSSDISNLSSTVDNPSTGVAATSLALSGITTRVESTEDGVIAEATKTAALFVAFGISQTNNYASDTQYAVGDGVVSAGLPWVANTSVIGELPGSGSSWDEVTTTSAAISENNTARIGYCYDATGQITDEKNATLCVAAGNTWVPDAAIATAIKALKIKQPDGTLAEIITASTVTADAVGDLQGRWGVKVDVDDHVIGITLNNDGDTGAFIVDADLFAVKDPAAPLSPLPLMSVTSGQIFLGTDVVVNGDLITTGTVTAARIDVPGVITAGALLTNSVTVTNNLRIGSGSSVFSSDSNGLYLGSTTFASAPFRVTPSGALAASNATITGNITASSLTISGAVIGTMPTANLDVSGIVSAGGIAITSQLPTDVSELNNDSAFVNAAGAASAAPVQSVAGATGVITAQTIITAGGIAITSQLPTLVSQLSNDSAFVNSSGAASAAPVQSVAGATGAITAQTIITAGNLVVQGDISNLITGSDVNQNVTAISGGTITTGTINVDRINVDGVTLSSSGGALIIRSGGVDTDQIAAGAVNTILAFETANILVAITSETNWTEIDDISLNTTGAAYVRITVECQFLSTDFVDTANFVSSRLIRNTTPVIGGGGQQRFSVSSGNALKAAADDASSPSEISANWLAMNIWPRCTLVYFDEAPASGINTYNFESKLQFSTSNHAAVSAGGYFHIGAEVVYR